MSGRVVGLLERRARAAWYISSLNAFSASGRLSVRTRTRASSAMSSRAHVRSVPDDLGSRVVAEQELGRAMCLLM